VLRRLVVVLALLLTCALAAPGIASARPSGGSDVDPFNGYRLKTFCHFGNCARGEVRVRYGGTSTGPIPA
jgi:hypothetical protein